MNTCIRFIFVGLALFHAGCDPGNHGPGQPAVNAPAPPHAPGVVSLPYVPCSEQPTAAEASLMLPDALPGGLWWGTLTNDTQMTTRTAEVLVSNDGRFRFLATNVYNTPAPMNAQMAGSFATLGNTFTGAGTAFLEPGQFMYDNAYTGDVSVTGVIAERGSITADWIAASGDQGCVEARYDAWLYEDPGLDSLQGDRGWIGGNQPVRQLTIAADGSFSGRGAAGGCTTAGRIVAADSGYHLYEVEQTITGCDFAGDYTGFAYLCPCGIGEWYLIVSIDDGTRAFRWAFSE